MLVGQEFLEFRIADEVVIVLPPLRTPIGMIEGRSLNLGVVVGQVDDELIVARRKRLEDFLVGFEPLRLRNTGSDAEDLVEDNGIALDEGREFGGLLPIAADKKRRKFIGFGGSEIGFGEFGSGDDGAHVRVDVRDVDAGSESLINLGVSFDEDIGRFSVSVDIVGEEGEIAVGIKEARVFGLRRDGGPAITGPVGVEREVNAEVGVGMGLGPLNDFREPRAGSENAGRSDPVLFESFFGGGVDGVHHTEVVGVDNQQARVGRIAETLSESIDGSESRLLSEKRSERGNEEGKGKAGETAKHESSEGATERIMKETRRGKREVSVV